MTKLFLLTIVAVLAQTTWTVMPWHRGFDVCRIGYRCGDNPYYPDRLETVMRMHASMRNVQVRVRAPGREVVCNRFADVAVTGRAGGATV